MPTQINVILSDGQHARLVEVKDDHSWREAILEEFGVREEPDQ